MPIKQITSFYDLEEWLKGKQQHVDELEHENIELTRENRKLQQEIQDLKVERAKFINELLSIKKSPVAADDEIRKIFTDSVPQILKGREQ